MSYKKILPPAVIGIIGGGQLGKMMAISAKQMGYKIAVFEPNAKGPCSAVADYEFNYGYNDEQGLKELFEISDVITYEFENVDVDTIDKYVGTYNIPQGTKPLKISNHRFIEKETINKCGLQTTDFFKVESPSDLMNALNHCGYPSVLKTSRFGYDGKGQVVLKSVGDIEKAKEILNVECILEAFVDYKMEISVIVTRGLDGNVKTLPVSENIHHNNILSTSIVPARISQTLLDRARDIAIKLVEKQDIVGTLAIEMFVTTNDELIINEVAPRPHNSGHYSIEGSYTSQFENHIRAITGLPLGNTNLREPVVMVNILGEHLDTVLNCMTNEEYSEMKVHLYGKEVSKVGRKMGHVVFYSKELAFNFIELLKGENNE